MGSMVIEKYDVKTGSKEVFVTGFCLTGRTAVEMASRFLGVYVFLWIILSGINLWGWW